MKRLFAIILILGMLLSLVACTNNAEQKTPYDEEETTNNEDAPTEPTGDDKLYVVTQEAHYDSDGICVQRNEYTYDDAAQILNYESYDIELTSEYNPVLDTYVYSYNADSPLILSASAQQEYGENGNGIMYRDPSLHWHLRQCDCQWLYKDGKPEAFICTSPSSPDIKDTFYFLYDDAGNISGLFVEEGETSRDFVLLDYDGEGRLIREIFTSKDGTTVEKSYTYENGRLISMQLRSGSCPYYWDSEQWDDNLSVRNTWEFSYDMDKNLSKLICYDETGKMAEMREFSYNRKGHPTETKITNSRNGKNETETITYTCDSRGNIIKAEHENGTWVEYTYEAMKVTEQQATYYHRRQGIDQKTNQVFSVFCGVYWDVTYYHLIPNPLFDLPYLELIA